MLVPVDEFEDRALEPREPRRRQQVAERRDVARSHVDVAEAGGAEPRWRPTAARTAIFTSWVRPQQRREPKGWDSRIQEPLECASRQMPRCAPELENQLYTKREQIDAYGLSLIHI